MPGPNADGRRSDVHGRARSGERVSRPEREREVDHHAHDRRVGPAVIWWGQGRWRSWAFPLDEVARMSTLLHPDEGRCSQSDRRDARGPAAPAADPPAGCLCRHRLGDYFYRTSTCVRESEGEAARPSRLEDQFAADAGGASLTWMRGVRAVMLQISNSLAGQRYPQVVGLDRPAADLPRLTGLGSMPAAQTDSTFGRRSLGATSVGDLLLSNCQDLWIGVSCDVLVGG